MTTFQAPPTRQEAILRQLRTEIVTGVLAPDTVVKDGEVAQRLGVSITPVREAIARLTAEGLIDSGPARSRRVTRVTRKSAADLVDVMELLACAGAAWGMSNLTAHDLATMRRRLQESVAALGRGDDMTAGATAIEISVIPVEASGNRELRIHLDLIIARALRLLALAPDSGVWDIWHPGYGEMIDLLERGETEAALTRYREVFHDFRALVAGMQLADEDS